MTTRQSFSSPHPSSLCLLLLAACGSPGSQNKGADTAAVPLGPACLTGATTAEAGVVADERVVEASGLALSRTRPGILWTHNDSGGGAELYALDETGQVVDVVQVDGAIALDWEDLAAGDWLGTPSLFIGDIGDNARARQVVFLWIVPEPTAGATSVEARQIFLSFPDGSHDAEALIVDPIDGSIVIVTKVQEGAAGVYRAVPADADELELEWMGDLESTEPGAPSLIQITAGDVSPDGRCVMLRTYTDLMAWERDPRRPLHEAFFGEMLPMTVDPGTNGEAVATGTDAYWTLNEGTGQTLFRYTATSEEDSGR
jgi:hypothetical protein